MKDTSPVDEVVRAAAGARGPLRRSSGDERSRWLHAVADALDEAAVELVRLGELESHLSSDRLSSELRRTSFQLRLLGRETSSGLPLAVVIDHADPSWGMGSRPDLRRTSVPIGVVAVFGASNFPFAFSVIGGDSASALAAGCPVVHKVHEAHPMLAARTAEIVQAALTSAGAPIGAFGVVAGLEAGRELVGHPLVDAVAFTGSTSGGRALMDLIAARPRPVPFFGEMGSTNPVFVTEAAWRDRGDSIAKGFAESVTSGVGQLCTKPGLVFVPAGVGALDTLRAHVQQPLGPMLTPRIEDSFDRARAAVEDVEGVLPAPDPTDALRGRAALLACDMEAVLAHPELLGMEMFGPAALIIEYDRHDRLARVADLLEGQLTATVHAEPDDDVEDLLDVLTTKTGRLLWNAWPTGVSVTFAQHHGGPYPASTSSTTSVGTGAIGRFLRPIAFQGFPSSLLPQELQDGATTAASRIDGVVRSG